MEGKIEPHQARLGGVFRFEDKGMSRNPDDINPKWNRPADWPYEYDFGSKNWDKKIAEMDARGREVREKYGFIYCPKCGTGHTSKTCYCRGCEYKLNWKEIEDATS